MSLDELMRQTSTVPEPTPAVLERGRAPFDDAINAARTRVTAVRRSRRRRVGLSALLGAAAAAALIVGPTVGSVNTPPPATAAAQVLLEASEAAGDQSGGWADADYWHVVVDSQTVYSATPERVERREEWLGRTSDGVIRFSTGGTLTPTFPWHWGLGGEAKSWSDLYELPTDPVALERVLQDAMTLEHSRLADDEGAQRSTDELLFHRIGDMLRASPASPALREALWAVAAGIPDVEHLGASLDAAGRPGVAVQLGANRYLVDPHDGRLLEWHSLAPVGATDFVTGSIPDGVKVEVTIRETILEQGPSDTAPQPVNASE
jgi:hypothetical protein